MSSFEECCLASVLSISAKLVRSLIENCITCVKISELLLERAFYEYID